MEWLIVLAPLGLVMCGAGLALVVRELCTRKPRRTFKRLDPQVEARMVLDYACEHELVDPDNTIRINGQLHGWSSRGELVPYEDKR